MNQNSRYRLHDIFLTFFYNRLCYNTSPIGNNRSRNMEIFSNALESISRDGVSNLRFVLPFSAKSLLITWQSVISSVTRRWLTPVNIYYVCASIDSYEIKYFEINALFRNWCHVQLYRLTNDSFNLTSYNFSAFAIRRVKQWVKETRLTPI